MAATIFADDIPAVTGQLQQALAAGKYFIHQMEVA